MNIYSIHFDCYKPASLGAMDWMFVSFSLHLPNLYVEALIPNVAFGGGDFEKLKGEVMGADLSWWIGAHIRGQIDQSFLS